MSPNPPVSGDAPAPPHAPAPQDAPAPLDPRLADWRPPASFAPVDSALEGVLVYAPRASDDERHALRQYRCPACGAMTAFDEVAGALRCAFCDHVAETDAQKVGRAAEARAFTVEALDRADTGLGVARRQLRCDNCGAEVAVEDDAISTSCAFCASHKVNVREGTHETFRPRFLVPFAVERTALVAKARDWLKRGWMHPSHLAGAARIHKAVGIYLPFWTFSAALDSHWEAEVGYNRTEWYRDNQGNRQSRTVIDWKWEKGKAHTEVRDHLVCGSTRVGPRLVREVAQYDLDALVEYSPDYLAGWQAQVYDRALPEAWALGRAAMRERARADCRRTIRSSHVRNFAMTADLANEAWRYVLLPVYVASYRFDGRVFQVLVNGQSGVVVGQKPVAWWKVWAAIAAMFLPSLASGLLGLGLLIFGIGLVPLVLAFVLFFPALWGALVVHRKATAAEQE